MSVVPQRTKDNWTQIEKKKRKKDDRVLNAGGTKFSRWLQIARSKIEYPVLGVLEVSGSTGSLGEKRIYLLRPYEYL